MHQFKFPIILLKQGLLALLLSFSIFLIPLIGNAAEHPTLSDQQIIWLGQQIYSNECGGQPDCLTSWNAGEDFPSLGIGHFIWYQTDQEEIFKESFPSLISHMEANDISIPQWISVESYNSPWTSREQFLEDIDKPRLVELRLFLQEQMPAQTQFIVKRFEFALEQIIATSPVDKHKMLEERFYTVANASVPYGLYALIDYINFKGEGVLEQERYKQQGWGLKQVLENMAPEYTEAPLQQFVNAAHNTLDTRVNNAPPERNEQRWLKGWNNRLATYLPPLQSPTND